MSEIAPFGEWLKRHRKALHMSREELAQRVGCSAITIRKLEADERRPSRVMAERLAEQLGVPLALREAFLNFARTGQTDVAAVSFPVATTKSSTAAAPFWNIARPATTIIGRERDIETVCAALIEPTTRLVTVIGVAGVGKTRLSLEVATRLREYFSSGVAFVPLAAVLDPASVVDVIAQTLNVTDTGAAPLDRLIAALGEKRMLLILDNFEQVIGAASQLAQMLSACPHISLLVTSRMPLHVRGEHQISLLPLALPDYAHLPDASAMAAIPAVALFVERVRAVVPQFALSEANTAAVAGICARLDGLPLAIELVAARSKVLPPAALLERLSAAERQGSLDLLTKGAVDLPERHRTLRGALDWSYSLLSAPERQLLDRLGVFMGGWSLEAAEAIGIELGPAGVLDALETLVDNSLVQAVSVVEGTTRFMMLETVREYALEHVERLPDVEAVRRRHAQFFLALAEEAEPHLTGAQQHVWLLRLEQEHPNIRAALRWAVDRRELNLAARLAGSLNRFWYLRGHQVEGRRWLDQIVALRPQAALTNWRESDENAEVDAVAWSKALLAAGSLAQDHGDTEAARLFYEESLSLRQRLSDHRGIAQTLHYLGMLAYDQGDRERSQALFEEVLVHQRAAGDQWGMAHALNNLGVLAAARGDLAVTEQYYTESLAIRRELGDIEGIANSLSNLGAVAHDRGDDDLAEVRFEESLALRRELGNIQGIVSSLHHLGEIHLAKGDFVRAHKRFVEALGLAADLNERRSIARCFEGMARLAIRQAASVGTPQELARRASRLLGAADVIRQTTGMPRTPIEEAYHTQSIADLGSMLDDATFRAAWTFGRSITLQQSLAYALDS